jgi:hypothetical protein
MTAILSDALSTAAGDFHLRVTTRRLETAPEVGESASAGLPKRTPTSVALWHKPLSPVKLETGDHPGVRFTSAQSPSCEILGRGLMQMKSKGVAGEAEAR